MSNNPTPTPTPEGLRDAAIALALAAGKLNVALDGQEKYRSHRQAVADRMNDLVQALKGGECHD